MTFTVKDLLNKYQCESVSDYKAALREIMQRIALQGLYKAGFFDQAAFYGGTALRLIYGLDRSSEDMDFSLLSPDLNFRLSSLSSALMGELYKYGFEIEPINGDRVSSGNINSAFLKEDTQQGFISIGLPENLIQELGYNEKIKIKLEVDITPPSEFNTEVIDINLPEKHKVRVYCLPDLLAGKLHALLFRNRIINEKGRDWYDMAWYIKKGYTKVNLKHLERRMRQSNNYSSEEPLTLQHLKFLLHNRIDKINIKYAKEDVKRFLTDTSCLDEWSCDLFHSFEDKFTE